MITRQQRRADARRAAKAAHSQLKVTAPEEGVYDSMPPETAADVLSDPRGKTTRAFREVCWAARERVFVPNQKPTEDKPQRKLMGKTFEQLCRAWNRSYTKRFKTIPSALKKFADPEHKCYVRGVLLTPEQRTQIMRGLLQVSALHDANIGLINNEIMRRMTGWPRRRKV